MTVIIETGSILLTMSHPKNKRTEELRVLMIDDSLQDVSVMRHLFRESQDSFSSTPVSFQFANDFEEGISFLNGHHVAAQPWTQPDLILLDLNLPGIKGHEGLKVLKEDRVFRRIPVVVFSGSTDEEEVFKSYDLQASLHIQKPSNVSDFKKVAKEIYSFWSNRVNLPN